MLLPTIETGRLLLRMYKPEELEIVYQMLADKDVTRFYPEGFSITREEVLSSMPRRLEKWRTQGFGQFGVFENANENLIGYCGLQPFDNLPEIEIYYGFFKGFWGRGIATEAAKAVLRFGFEESKLEKIAAGTHPDNIASQKVLLKIGLEQKEGLKRIYNTDSVYFLITKENYQPDAVAKYDLSYTEIDG
jgi:ribosomal-protein-alanine N-acetyltransferase